MRNRGKYRCPIEIWTKQETGEKDELDEPIYEDVAVATNLFADFESRAGSLISGRPADTVMSKVTSKFSYPFNNYPVRLLPEIHWIKYKGVKFNIEYFLNEGLDDIEAQVFVSDDTVGL